MLLATLGAEGGCSFAEGTYSPPPYLPPQPVVFHGEPAHPVYLRCLFLSTHLHNPCLGSRGHDLSGDDNIMGLWLLGIHGQVVIHIGKDIGVVVPLYVLVVFKRGGLFWGTVSRCPSYRQSFRGGVEIPYFRSSPGP